MSITLLYLGGEVLEKNRICKIQINRWRTSFSGMQSRHLLESSKIQRGRGIRACEESSKENSTSPTRITNPQKLIVYQQIAQNALSYPHQNALLISKDSVFQKKLQQFRKIQANVY